MQSLELRLAAESRRAKELEEQLTQHRNASAGLQPTLLNTDSSQLHCLQKLVQIVDASKVVRVRLM